MLNLAIRNLDQEGALKNLPEEGCFLHTNKGKFVLRPASWKDELVYLVAVLHCKGKLKWSRDKKSGKLVARYRKLRIEVITGFGSSLGPWYNRLFVKLSKNQRISSASPLIDEFLHAIWHTLDCHHLHTSLAKWELVENQRDERIAEKVMRILKK